MATDPTNQPHCSDTDLLKAWAAGDESAFSVIVARYQDMLAGVVARRMRGDPRLLANTDDVVQTVFIRLVQSCNRIIVSARPLRQWLIRVAINEATNCYRRERPQARPDSGGLLDGTPGPSPPRVTDQQLALERCLDDLPVRLSVPLYFELWEEMSRTDIADLLDVANATVTVRLQQAHEWLRGCVQRRLANPRGG